MFNKVEKTISDHKMLEGKSHVIVALSGGADSMSLLHCMAVFSDVFGIKVSAAHLNHNLRGEESQRDFEFVSNVCEKMGIELFAKSVDIGKISAEKKIGLEQCGREERYSFFSSLVRDCNTVVATSHTASDNAETVLMNITRGCGLEGLTGIPYVRGNIVRPLLDCSRAEIERYCEINQIPFVTDSSNLSTDYSRNKIRLSVIPELQKINPMVENSINRLSQIASKDLSVITKLGNDAFKKCRIQNGLSISSLQLLDNNIVPFVIRIAIDHFWGIVPEKKHIELVEKIIDDRRGAVDIKKNLTAKVTGDRLVFEKKNQMPIISFEPRSVRSGDAFLFNNKKYSISEKKDLYLTNNKKINKNLLNNCISCDIISSDTLIRHRQSGDVFKPLGRNCTKTLKKLFTELKIPVSQRDSLLVIANGNNVLWVESVGVSCDAVPKGDSCFTVDVKEMNNDG